MPVRAFSANGLSYERREKTAIPYEDTRPQGLPWSFRWPAWAILKVNRLMEIGVKQDQAVHAVELDLKAQGLRIVH